MAWIYGLKLNMKPIHSTLIDSPISTKHNYLLSWNNPEISNHSFSSLQFLLLVFCANVGHAAGSSQFACCCLLSMSVHSPRYHHPHTHACRLNYTEDLLVFDVVVLWCGLVLVFCRAMRAAKRFWTQCLSFALGWGLWEFWSWKRSSTSWWSRFSIHGLHQC